jgi:hypothetical protein
MSGDKTIMGGCYELSNVGDPVVVSVLGKHCFDANI